MQKLQQLLEELSNAHGISGHEGSICEIMKRELEPFCDEMTVDKMGNLIATRKGKAGAPSVMVASHMDEIGLMVKYIDDNGFLNFVTVGGFFSQTLLNQRVVVHTTNGPIVGVIGSKPPHVMKEEDKKNPVKIEDMFVDVGAKNHDDAISMGIDIGTPMSIDRDFKVMKNDLVTGKAFDNRAGCAMLIEAMRQISEMDVDATIYAVGTVQEEVGLKGARTSAFGLNPDVALATDVTVPGDHPGITKKDASVSIGKGPVLTVVDAAGRGIMVPASILKWLTGTAKDKGIDYQLDVGDGGTTDATSIHMTKEGIPTGVLSVATRYIHSPVEVLDMNDLRATAKLIAESAASVGKYF